MLEDDLNIGSRGACGLCVRGHSRRYGLGAFIALCDRHIPFGTAVPELHGIPVFGRAVAVERRRIGRELQDDHPSTGAALLRFGLATACYESRAVLGKGA